MTTYQISKKFYFILTLILFFSFFHAAEAASKSDVVINEIAWMGSTSSANNEWLELKNNTLYQINLTGWTLNSADGKLKIKLTGIIYANGFYLMERTDDNSVPNIKADLIYTGTLSNSGMDLRLYDNSNNVIDEVDCIDDWPAGDNTTKQTMEKTATGWQTSQNPNGTPRAQNSAGSIEKPAPTITYPAGIILNELMPSAKKVNEANEWFELFNTNNFNVDLSQWKVKDIKGAMTVFIIPQSTEILTNGFLVFKRSDTKIILSSKGDGLNLYSPDGKIVDTVSYEDAPIDQSYNKIGDTWQWSKNPTPNAKNIITVNAVVPKTVPASLPKTNKSVNSTGNKDTASLDTFPNTSSGTETQSPWLLFCAVVGVVLILAITAIFIKIKINEKVS